MRQDSLPATVHTSIRVAPEFRCTCGRVLKAYDVDAYDNTIRLDCPRCFRRLLEIELRGVRL